MGAYLGLALVSVSWAETPENPASWEEWVKNQTQGESIAIVQNRRVVKVGGVQLAGIAGISERKDFYNTYTLGFSGRYHFTETHGWEVLRLSLSYPSRSPLASEIEQQTSFHPDVQLSRVQLGTAYVYTPIYGKYAWNSKSLVHFDIYGTLGTGVRFTETNQFFGEAGLGMNHYFSSSDRWALVPEIRVRGYSEKRTAPTFVLETLFGLGVSWLL